MNKETTNDNYVKMMEAGNLSSETGKITVHTMPKRYMSVEKTVNSAKSTGFLILLIGFAALVLAVSAIYFFLIKKEPQIEISQSNVVPAKEQPATSTQEKAEKSEAGDVPVLPSLLEGSSSSSSLPHETASGTEAVPSGAAPNGVTGFLVPLDSDQDGLSDYEELIFDSSPNSVDTDGDTYFDLDEVMNMYDPAGKGALLDNLNIEEYRNEKFAFSFYTSGLWNVESISGSESLIINLGRDQYFLVVSQAMGDYETFDEWYLDTFDQLEIDETLRYGTNGWQGVADQNGLNFYFQHPSHDYIISFSYQIGDDNTLYYRNIFEMMIRSLKALPE